MLCLLESWWRTSTAIVSSSAPTFLSYLHSVAVLCDDACAVAHGLCRVGYAPAGMCVGASKQHLQIDAISAGMLSAVMSKLLTPGIALTSGIAGTVFSEM